MRRILILLILLVVGVFAVVDRPIETAKKLVGEEEEQRMVARQSLMGLSLFLSRDERREGRRVAVIQADWLY